MLNKIELSPWDMELLTKWAKEAEEKDRRRAEAKAKMDQGIGIDLAEYFELFNPTEWPEGTC